jgi:hypothetical protein
VSETIDVLEATAILATRQQYPAQAARLFATGHGVRAQMDHPLAAPERAELDAALSAIRAELGDHAFRIAWDAGRALTIEAAIDCAEKELLAGTDTPAVTSVVIPAPADGCA